MKAEPYPMSCTLSDTSKESAIMNKKTQGETTCPSHIHLVFCISKMADEEEDYIRSSKCR